MEFLRFIFSSFWVWLGFVVLVAAAGGAVAEIVKAIRPARKIAVYRTGDVVRVEVEGAGRGDIPAAVKAAKGRDTEDVENAALLSSKKMDYCTPPDFFDRLNDEFGFVLDAAATAKSAKCPAYYTPETDGLNSPWNLAGGGCCLV